MLDRKAVDMVGLSVEFYKAFRVILSQDLLDVFSESLATSSLPLSCRRVITLLPKKGNVHDTKNWCPVLLLCTDNKILSQALAIQLKEALEQSSIETRRTVYLAAQWSDCQPHLGCFGGLHFIGVSIGLSLGQEKAFDCVECSFLWRTMERIRFSTGLITKIQVGSVRAVLCPGCSIPGCSIPEGPLLNKLPSSLFLPGFNSNAILSAYADDVIDFFKDRADVDAVLNVTNRFCVTSATQVHLGKNEALAVSE